MRSFCRILKVIIAGILFASPVFSQVPVFQHPAPANIIVNSARTNDIMIDANNNKWVAFANYGLGIYDGNAWIMLDTSNSNLPSDSVICMDFEVSGNAWLGTKEGLVYKSGINLTVFNSQNSPLPSDIITAVFCAPGKVWLGTNNGLISYDGSTWNIYNMINSSIANDSITTITGDGVGNLWIGTRNGLSNFNNSTWTNFTTANSILNRYILDLEIDNLNRVWISCGNKGQFQHIIPKAIYFIDNNVVKEFAATYFDYGIIPTYKDETRLAKDNSGRIYFPCNIFNYFSRDIVRIDGDVVDVFPCNFMQNGLLNYERIFRVDQNDVIWSVTRWRFYMYSMNFAGYIDNNLLGLDIDNFRVLDINEVAAGINVGGDMHWDYTNPKYEVPKGSGKRSVYASSLWIGGMDSGGQVHVAGQTYRQTGFDYWPGPIEGLSAPFDSAGCIQFNRVWKINKRVVETFKDEFLLGNVSNGTYDIPEELLTWPAIGNGNITGELAPFNDFNLDGIYNPYDGDSPLIKGDQMIYWVFNDSLSIHTGTAGSKLGVEVHASAYAFNCTGIADSNVVLNRTTLYHYDIINRSSNTYDNFYVGLWCDSDLGNPEDDMVGCDTILSAGFTYNGDNEDDASWGYGFNPPMQNVKILKGTLAELNDLEDNDLDGTVDEPGERTTMNHFHYYNNINNNPYGNPTTPIDHYRYLQSVWLDGTDVYDSIAGQPTNFMYSGTPYSGTGWSMNTTGLPSDMRMLLSSGAVTLAPQDTFSIDFAYIFTRDSVNANGLTTSIARNQADLQRVQNWFDNDNFPSCEVYLVSPPGNHTTTTDLRVFPNPSSNIVSFTDGKAIISGLDYTIYNSMGKEMNSGNIPAGGINISTLESNVYFIKIRRKNENIMLQVVKIN